MKSFEICNLQNFNSSKFKFFLFCKNFCFENNPLYGNYCVFCVHTYTYVRMYDTPLKHRAVGSNFKPVRPRDMVCGCSCS